MTSSRQCLTVKPLVQFQRMLEPTCVGLDPRTPSPSGWRTLAEIANVGFSPLAVFFLTTRQVDFDAESAALAAAATVVPAFVTVITISSSSDKPEHDREASTLARLARLLLTSMT